MMFETANSAARPSTRQQQRPLLAPALYGVAVLGLRLALSAAAIAALYLLFGLLSGQLGHFPSLPAAEKARVLGNLDLAARVLYGGLAAAALLGALVYFYEEAAGYVIALAGLALYAGVPFLIAWATQVGPAAGNAATFRAASALPHAAAPLFLLGGLLVARDVVLRLRQGLRPPSAAPRGSLRYGADALAEGGGVTAAAAGAVPFRLSPLGKCWEGPFCRSALRPHCPVFHAKQACWRVKKGCYCEEEVMTAVTAGISGVHLPMAGAGGTHGGAVIGIDIGPLGSQQRQPTPKYNFSGGGGAGAAATTAGTPPRRKPEPLSAAQKRERCRQCVIYNEHQRRKYALLVPVVIASVGALCLLNAPALREGIQSGFAGVEAAVHRFSFAGAGGADAGFRLGEVSPSAVWVLITALTVIAVSKALQALEWAVFKIKI